VTTPSTGSILLVTERFREGDPRFLDELRSCRGAASLRGFSRRWYEDGRPFARASLLRYVDDGCDNPHHRPLVKALLRAAELAGDDELMAHLVAAFDRIMVRRMVRREHWDYELGRSVARWELRRGPVESGFNPRTRAYLRRRAWRYLRLLGWRDPARYRRAAAIALRLYRDADLAEPGQLLSAWGLVHALYWGSDVLSRPPHDVLLAPGRRLDELRFSPFKPEAWSGDLDAVLALALEARSELVRRFAVWILRERYAERLPELDLWRLAPLLAHESPALRALATELVPSAPGAEHLSLEKWLTLLQGGDLEALAALCRRFETAVTPARLSLEQRVILARHVAEPVALLGLEWARQLPLERAADLEAALPAVESACPAARIGAVRWLTAALEGAPAARPEHLRELLDNPHADARAAATAALDASARWRGEVRLWTALAESPYPETRDFLLRRLPEWRHAFPPETLQHLWACSLLSVHRGSRAKHTSLRQIAARLLERPAEAEQLLPLLRIALRSARPAERAAGLGAIGRAAYADPSLRDALARHLPELALLDAPEGAA
jgi:hypothetical protein